MRSVRSAAILSIALLCAAQGIAFAAKKSASAQRSDPLRQYQIGLAHLQSGRADLAVAELEKSVQGEPDNLIAVYTLGLAYFGIRELDKASRVFLGLLERDPLFTEAHNSLGLVYLEQGERMKARAAFERVISDKRYLTPEVAKFNLGAVLLEDGLIEEATSYLRAATLARPDNQEWRFRYALALEAGKEYAAARKELEATLALRPTYLEALFRLGMVDLALKDVEGARRWFTRVREMEPGSDFANRAAEQLKALEP